MGTCKYCGKDAGWFSHSHTECKNKHEQGLKVNYLQLPVNNLPTQYQNSQIGRLEQISILKKLQNGIIPTSNMPAPMMLGRGETIIWTYDGVSMYQEKTVKEYGCVFRSIPVHQFR